MNYLIASTSFRLIDEKISQIVDSKNIITFDYSLCTLEDILQEAAYISIFDERKYLIVKNAIFFASAKLSDKEVDNFLKYLQNPNSNTIIIFCCLEKLDERKKITKYFKKEENVIILNNLSELDLQKKLQTKFLEKGFKIDTPCLKYLTKSCLNNYDLAYNEMEKITCFYSKSTDTIKLEDLKKLTKGVLENNIFKLIQAIMAKNTKESFKVFADLKILKEEPIAWIVLLAREYRNVYIIKNKPEYTQKLKLQSWQVEKYKKLAYQYTNKELKENLKKLYNLDKNIKSGKIEKYLGFQLFMLTSS